MELHPGYDTFIQDFKKSYADLVVYCAKKLKVSLTIPWKVHVLAVHVPQFLEQRPNFGLGVYAEQVVESSHSRMKPTLTRFKTLKQVDEAGGGREAEPSEGCSYLTRVAPVVIKNDLSLK